MIGGALLRPRRKASSPMRSFDPCTVGAFECRAWQTYYRRKWAAFLLAALGLVSPRSA